MEILITSVLQGYQIRGRVPAPTGAGAIGRMLAEFSSVPTQEAAHRFHLAEASTVFPAHTPHIPKSRRSVPIRPHTQHAKFNRSVPMARVRPVLVLLQVPTRLRLRSPYRHRARRPERYPLQHKHRAHILIISTRLMHSLLPAVFVPSHSCFTAALRPLLHGHQVIPSRAS